MRGLRIMWGERLILSMLSGDVVSEQEYEALKDQTELGRGMVFVGALQGDASVRVAQVDAVAGIAENMKDYGFHKDFSVKVGLTADEPAVTGRYLPEVRRRAPDFEPCLSKVFRRWGSVSLELVWGIVFA